MKVMVFVDLENFNKSVSALGQREPVIGGLHKFLSEYLENNLSWSRYNPHFIRTYLYTGTFEDNLKAKLKRQYANETDLEKRHLLEGKIKHVEKKQLIQKQIFKELLDCDFVELRTKPLQYSPVDLSIFQKGVDVQIAVDLLTFGHSNNYDVAILCTGDVDLLESVRYIKNMGKKVILLSHPNLMAYELGRIADHFIDITKISEDNINFFSKIK
ncbi:MAG: NYN domain-containing protein [Candidatus Diapherotrites archaeon]